MKLIPCISLLLALPVAVEAQTVCSGRPYDGQNQLSVAWDDCWYPGSTATTFKTLQCAPTPTTNVTSRLHLQFKAGQPIASVFAATATLDIFQDPGAPLVPFYHYEAGGCAGTSPTQGLTLQGYPEPPGCEASGFSSYCSVDGVGNECSVLDYLFAPDFPTPGVGRLIVFGFRATGRSLDGAANVWLCSLNFNNRLRNACAGCATPASVLWQSLTLESDDGAPAVCLTGPDGAKGPDRATLNGGTDIDAVRPTTWGRIKALYR